MKYDKVHLVAIDRTWGIACNNFRSRGPATYNLAKVTCKSCKRAVPRPNERLPQ